MKAKPRDFARMHSSGMGCLSITISAGLMFLALLTARNQDSESVILVFFIGSIAAFLVGRFNIGLRQAAAEEIAYDTFAELTQQYERFSAKPTSPEDLERFLVRANRFIEEIDRMPKESKSDEFRDYLARKREDIQHMMTRATVLTSTKIADSDEIATLAKLRETGAISDHEFQAFSERFKLSTGEKARTIVRAISELHKEYQSGAMGEGNYHAALWGLLDKLDRKT